MPKKATRKSAAKELGKKNMKGTKGGLIGLLLPSAGIKVTGIKLGAPIAAPPANQFPPTPCI